MKVAYVQPIFAPNEEMLERNISSIKTFIEYYIKNKYDFKCVFGGYCSDDISFNIIGQLIYTAIPNAIVTRYDRNYGKAYVVNKLVNDYLSNEDYFLTADSDICFDINEANIIERLLEMANLSNNPAIIGLNQLVNNCHLMELLHQNIVRYSGKYGPETICWPNVPGGMAGGCLFINLDFWRVIGGYKVLGVYAADDATLLIECIRIKNRFIFANSINCIHPDENNSEYQRWKIENASKVLEHNNAIASANEFWSK